MKSPHSIIERIKKEQIKPTPKWVFLLKDALVWSLFALSIVIGIGATSVLIYAFEGVYKDLFEHAGHSLIEKILLLFPLFWLISLIAFTFLAVILGKKTKTGYRYPIFYYVIASVLFSVVGGYVVHRYGGSEKIEEIFSEKINIVKSTEEKRMAMWSLPQEGYLSGEILSFDEAEITLLDFEGKEWIIDINETFIRPSVDILQGEKIKLLGEINAPGVFKAEEIRPWQGKGRKHGKGKGGQRNQ
jgi:hypothetical protein